MIYYLIRREDGSYVAQGYTKKPINCVGTIPAGIDPEDYDVLTVIESENNGVVIQNIVVDEDAKSAKVANAMAADEARAWTELRLKRDALLAASDFSQLPDAPLSQQQRDAYTTYRQQLRDLPQNTNNVFNPTFPSKPE